MLYVRACILCTLGWRHVENRGFLWGLTAHIAYGFEDAATEETPEQVVETVAAAAASSEAERGTLFGGVLVQLVRV